MSVPQVVTSERGGELLLVNTYKYKRIRLREDKLIRWRCVRNDCTASVLSTFDKTEILERSGVHKHFGTAERLVAGLNPPDQLKNPHLITYGSRKNKRTSSNCCSSPPPIIIHRGDNFIYDDDDYGVGTAAARINAG